MNSKIYRCGNCGAPTDKDGINLSGAVFQRVIDIIYRYPSSSHTEQVHGSCCFPENQEPEYRAITRDMAIDAGDRSLEGQTIKW